MIVKIKDDGGIELLAQNNADRKLIIRILKKKDLIK